MSMPTHVGQADVATKLDGSFVGGVGKELELVGQEHRGAGGDGQQHRGYPADGILLHFQEGHESPNGGGDKHRLEADRYRRAAEAAIAHLLQHDVRAGGNQRNVVEVPELRDDVKHAGDLVGLAGVRGAPNDDHGVCSLRRINLAEDLA
jgi:hypothetical protein